MLPRASLPPEGPPGFMAAPCNPETTARVTRVRMHIPKPLLFVKHPALSMMLWGGIACMALCCGSARHASTSSPRLLSLNQPEQRLAGCCTVHLQYHGQVRDTYAFKASIENLSNDSLTVDPSMFGYYPLQESGSPPSGGATWVAALDPEDKIWRLNRRRDSLLQAKNPYALAGGAKKIALEGLLEGAVAAAFGQDPQQLELQRREEEEAWDAHRAEALARVNRDLERWTQGALRQTSLPPQARINGWVYVPIKEEAHALNVLLPLKGTEFLFAYRRLR